MKIIVNELKSHTNVRSNLSELRKQIKDPQEKESLRQLLQGQEAMIEAFLRDQDPKTRKNAALLIGDLGWQRSAQILYETYQKENTLFVRSSYLQALAGLEISQLLPELKEQLKRLQGQEATEENSKHIQEEMRQIRQIIIRYEGIPRHTFAPLGKTLQVLLLTNRNLRANIAASITEGTAAVHPLGVMVTTDHFTAISVIRTYRELVFPVNGGKVLSAEPRTAARELWQSDCYELLSGLHTEAGTFYYRLECKGGMDLSARSEFARRFTGELDRLSEGKLVNSPSDYEVEIRLIAGKDGRFFPCLRLYTYKDTRFYYRKNTIAAAMHPSTAALIAELARPYLKENAQSMDPFCGVGTLLIERNHLVPAKDMYATDIFGDAITAGRENAQRAKVLINFIHRDFFDFHHEYPFDEIITDMPMRGTKTREEMDQLYDRFFRKMPEVLSPGAVVILYTNETGFVKKQLRLHPEYSLLQETNMQKATAAKAGFDLFILRYLQE